MFEYCDRCPKFREQNIELKRKLDLQIKMVESLKMKYKLIYLAFKSLRKEFDDCCDINLGKEPIDTEIWMESYLNDHENLPSLNTDSEIQCQELNKNIWIRNKKP